MAVKEDKDFTEAERASSKALSEPLLELFLLLEQALKDHQAKHVSLKITRIDLSPDQQRQ